MSTGTRERCHCLCRYNHPEHRGVCSGSADMLLHFASGAVKIRAVLLCAECAARILADHQKFTDGRPT